jgi:hypothetical protein
MKARDVIDIQLEAFFGDRFPHKIQRLVDEELNRGHWVDGYDLAVCKGVVSGDDARKLLEIVLGEYPVLRMDEMDLRQEVATNLPQSQLEPVSWIIHESGAFVLSDTLRVARFDGASLTWVSHRISYDGIEFDSLADGKLRGRAWMPSSGTSPDSPFVFDFETGEMLEGAVVA